MSSTPCPPSSSQATCGSVALLLLRLVAGAAFVIHGWGKIQHPFTWMGPDGFPGVLQLLAALAEFGGGILWILGLMTRVASAGIAITMVVAVFVVTFGMKAPFVNMTGGPSSELAAVFLCVAIVLFTLGPGRFALDRKICGSRTADSVQP